MKKCLPLLLSFILLLLSMQSGFSQTTYNFNSGATLSAPIWSFWKTRAVVTIDGVRYQMDCGGNGSFANSATEGVSNSASLKKDGSGGDQFTLKREDGQPFQFYGFWVKHQSMNSYSQFMSLPPWYTITYNLAAGGSQTDKDMSAKQGNNSALTTTAITYTKDLAVTSVSINFNAIMYFWIDDIKVGPVASTPAPTISAHPVNKAICVGSNTSFSVTAQNATSYQWQVNTGSGFTNISNNTIYSGVSTSTLTLTGAISGMNGYLYRCVVGGSSSVTSTSATLNVSGVNVATSLTNIACNGTATGAITVTPSGGTAPYTYLWSNGATSSSVTGLAAGPYSVTVTDAIGCSTSRNFTIVQPTAINASTSQTNVSCNGGSNGSATITVSGGYPPYSYSWAPMGGTAATATGLAPGNYTVTVTDDVGCQITRNVTITQPAAMQIGTSQTNITCNGGSTGSAGVTVSGGTAPYTYMWSNGATSATAAGLVAGGYSVTITDATGCQATRHFTLTQPTAMQIGTSQTNIACNGGSTGSAGVTISGGTAPYFYSWAPMGGTAATATGLVAGSYTVTITDANNCQTTRNFTITQPTAMQVSTTQTNVACNGASNGSAGVTVSGGTAPYTYMWSNGATSASAAGLAAGVYSVTITDANGCQTTRNFTITQPPAFTASVNKTTETICSGNNTSIELTGSNGTAFNWTVASVSGDVAGYSNGSGETIFQALTGNGKINYTITPSNGICTGTPIQVAVTVNGLTTITSQPVPKAIEEEESTSFEISAANATSYQWQVDNGNGFVNISNNTVYSGSTSSTLSITNATGELDSYSYRCIASGLCAPAAISDAVNLDVNVKAIQTISFETIPAQIYGEQYTLQASSNSGLAVEFSSSDPSIATINNGVLYAKKAGQVTITANQPGNNAYKPAPAAEQLITIQKRPLTIEINPAASFEKIYDGTPSLTLPQNALLIQNAISGDALQVSASANFSSATAGMNKELAIDNFLLTGNNLANYSISHSSIEGSGTIQKKLLTPQVKNNAQFVKTYDGSANLELETNPVELTGLVGIDEVFVQATAAFDDKNAGTEKPVSITITSLVGYDKDNYELSTSSLSGTGTLLPKSVEVTQSAQRGIFKTYDGTTTMNPNDLSLEISGIVTGDDVSVEAKADFESKNAGTNIPLTIHSLQLDGKDKGNYKLTSNQTSAVGTIEPFVLTVQFNLNQTISKVYDGTTTAAIHSDNLVLPALFGEDEVTIEVPETASYADKNGGTGKTVLVDGIKLTGNDAGNYTLETAAITASVGTILPKAVTVKAIAATKVYGSQDPDFNYSIEGILEGEKLEGKLSRTEGNNVGEYDITIGSVSGGTNYIIESFEKASLTITKADLLIKADSKSKKQGQANPVFTLQYLGLAAGDQPSDLSVAPIVTTNAFGNSPLGIFEIRVEGAASPNYNISYQNGQLTITPASSQNSVQAWSNSSDQLQIRIYAERAQKASIVLYTVSGQTLILEAKQLTQGINTYTIRTGHLSAGTYILGVYGQYFKEADKVNIK